MDGLPDVLGFSKTQRSRRNEPMAVRRIGKRRGPWGLWEGLGLGLGGRHCRRGGKSGSVPECLMCPVCLSIPPPSWTREDTADTQEGGWAGWVWTLGRGDECYKVEGVARRLCVCPCRTGVWVSGGNVSQSSGRGWRAGCLERRACSPSPPHPAQGGPG